MPRSTAAGHAVAATRDGIPGRIYSTIQDGAFHGRQVDDKFTYTVNGADLVITATGDARSSITVTDFASGHVGLTLGEHAATPVI